MRSRRERTLLVAVGLLLAVMVPALVWAEVPEQAKAGQPAAAANPGPAGFDPAAATEAYLAKLSSEQRARSDAYFEGGYWLQLWGFLYGAAVAILLLATHLSARMRDLAARITRVQVLQTALYWVQYLVAATVLTFPLTVYEGFIREHKYGLATQTFGPWLGDQAKGLAIGAVLGALALMAIYAVIRRAPRTWWLWGAGVSVVFMVFAIAIGPGLHRAGVQQVHAADRREGQGPDPAPGSRQRHPGHRRLRVRRLAPDHPRLCERRGLSRHRAHRPQRQPAQALLAAGDRDGHGARDGPLRAQPRLQVAPARSAVLIVAGFAFVRWAFDRVAARWGSRWGIRGIADVAGLPLLVLLLSVFFFVLTPVTNTMIRTQEVEADIFGLNAARQPDGEAEVALKLGEYRKLKPGPVEEFIFFDHPSGYSRILMAMRWKAENLR